MKHLWRLMGATGLALLVFALPAAATPDQGKAGKDEKASNKGTKHDFRSPMQKKYDAALKVALVEKLKGNAKGKVHRANGQFVQLEREGTDRVFVVIAEFGNARHSAYPDTAAGCLPPVPPATTPPPCFPGDGSALRYDGPLHNEIDEPNRAIDNSTLWQDDYNTAHYENMYFNRMAEYFEHQSSNRYSIAGDVNGWVKVPFNEARYGRDFCGGIVCNNTWFLIRDAMSIWVKGQLDAGKTLAEIQTYLKTFDLTDRYDSNGNGNFNEPDGFIDHFQIVHAGGDQAAGDPFQGTDAIWSHRWYAALAGGGPNGFPGFNAGSGGASGGLPGGLPNNPTGVWVGDYTIQPENGGLGVFAHEYAHDLGLPDLYDTSGNTGGAENSTGFWSLMSSGANIGDGGPNGIGDAPTDLTAWELFQLGWLSAQGAGKGPFYDVARAGRTSVHKLGDNDAATKQAQALFVVLPDKKRIDNIGAPKTGSFAFYSSMGDNIETTMTKSVSGGGALTAQVNYDIEEHFDYAFLEASVGGTWTPIVTNLSQPASEDQSGLNASGAGIDGSTAGAYVALTGTVPAAATAVRFRYVTDGGVAPKGILIDDVVLAGVSIGTAETDTEGWTFDGFRRTTGTEESFHFNAYVAENRQYDDYDRSLATAYNFGFLDTLAGADKVEHFRYQNGLLINYWDNSFGDNNVGDHPGGGLILPVDAHPTFAHHPDGHLVRPRIMSFDSTFGLERTDSIVINKNSQPITIASQPAVPLFDDRRDWWFNADEHATTGNHAGRYEPGWFGVNVPKTGTTIRVVNESTGAQGAYMQVEVNGR